MALMAVDIFGEAKRLRLELMETVHIWHTRSSSGVCLKETRFSDHGEASFDPAACSPVKSRTEPAKACRLLNDDSSFLH